MFQLFILLAVLGVTQAIVCTPFLCAGAKFDATQCKGSIIKNGGFCGCTDACAKVEGEDCQASVSMFHGSPPIGKCDDGLKCVAPNGGNPFGRGQCIKDVQNRSVKTTCEQRRRTAMIIMVVYKGQWTPRCDVNGKFTPEQCDNTGSCFCVDVETGKITSNKRIQGQVQC
ncbi:hypothetical protein SNE40_021450 [Patella caerulea]|uniref:Thyroglobulin type-1 domain-containing protein n=1 Tax=Patella caerulea TaxID=87958 RepID=A0AAN8G4E7_PATCE